MVVMCKTTNEEDHSELKQMLNFENSSGKRISKLVFCHKPGQIELHGPPLRGKYVICKC